MHNRRLFLKSTAISFLGSPFVAFPQSFSSNNINSNPVVKQPEDGETYFVRENTPITFHITKSFDNISSVSVLTEELLPGSIIPVHKHLNEDEYFIFHSGIGEITILDQTYSFKPGTTGFVPKNTWHGLKNTGNEKVIFSFGYTPSGFEEFFRQIGTPKGQPFQSKPKEERDRIAKKFGMVFK